MNTKFELISILTSISLCFVFVSAKIKARQGPGGMSFNDSTTCDEFSKFARFNPYSVLYEKWFVFFYWAPPKPQETYIFTFPTANHTKYLHKLLDGKTIIPVDWSARHILMENHRNESSLLVERSDRGEYWLYLLYRVTKGQKIRPRDVRLKQTADNRLVGFMDCDQQTVIAMSRISEVPPKKRLQDEAARLGFRGRRGKSYLYQGHEWMPIPEDDDEHYWQREKKKTGKDKSSEEVKSSEQSNKEEEKQNTNVSEKAKEKEKKHVDIQPSLDEERLVLEKTKEKEINFDEEKYVSDETKEKEKYNAEMQANIDEKELKERCVEIKPVYWNDPLNHEPITEPDNLPIAKEPLNSLETNMLEFMRPTNTPDSALEDKKPEEILETKLENKNRNNKLEDHQVRNQPEEAKKDVPKNLQSPKEETQVTGESDNKDCNTCYEGHYIESTDASYMGFS